MGYIGARVKNTVCLLACKLTILANAERILSILLASVFRSSSSDSEGATAAAVIPIEWLPNFSMSFSISEVRPCTPETSRNHWHVVQQVLIQQLCDPATAWRSSCILHLAWLARSLSMQAASMNLVPGLLYSWHVDVDVDHTHSALETSFFRTAFPHAPFHTYLMLY